MNGQAKRLGCTRSTQSGGENTTKSYSDRTSVVRLWITSQSGWPKTCCKEASNQIQHRECQRTPVKQTRSHRKPSDTYRTIGRDHMHDAKSSSMLFTRECHGPSSSSWMLAAAIEHANGFPMKVGPCISGCRPSGPLTPWLTFSEAMAAPRVQ